MLEFLRTFNFSNPFEGRCRHSFPQMSSCSSDHMVNPCGRCRHSTPSNVALSSVTMWLTFTSMPPIQCLSDVIRSFRIMVNLTCRCRHSALSNVALVI
ncbi:hypothetical protein AVEN_192321-1 [Araneus ventricosus]|uniref:Uncharacterized protein n=1 Tax=Araneus ventricosus TaxID=182803 RepID=A0A4Y2WKN9_ARAVE|nr:hypothetical protein AVEN_192321-1 [Araneus ventricosus]